MNAAVPKRKTLMEPLVVTAALLGIIQGFFWFLLCLIAIFLYEGIIDPIGDEYNLINVGRTIFDFYLNKEHTNVNELFIPFGFDVSLIVGPKEFNVFMYFYLILNCGLFLISFVMICDYISGKYEKYYKHTISIWTAFMVASLILDFIFVCLLGHDFGQVNYYISVKSNPARVMLALDIALVMAIVARGFILWIVNLIFVIVMLKHWQNLNKKENIDVYTNGSQPAWKLASSLYLEVHDPEAKTNGVAQNGTGNNVNGAENMSNGTKAQNGEAHSEQTSNYVVA